MTVALKTDCLVVTTDLTLARGNYERGDLDIHVAFGAPGVPLAFQASVCSSPPGFLDAPVDATCLVLPHATVPRAPAHAAFGVGRPTMAGEIVSLPSSALLASLEATSMATLRLSEVRSLPSAGSAGWREIVVRLGESRGDAYVVGTVEVDAERGITLRDADARLCGPNIDETPLMVVTKAKQTRAGVPPPLAPRSISDDLCVRFRI